MCGYFGLHYLVNCEVKTGSLTSAKHLVMKFLLIISCERSTSLLDTQSRSYTCLFLIFFSWSFDQFKLCWVNLHSFALPFKLIFRVCTGLFTLVCPKSFFESVLIHSNYWGVSCILWLFSSLLAFFVIYEEEYREAKSSETPPNVIKTQVILACVAAGRVTKSPVYRRFCLSATQAVQWNQLPLDIGLVQLPLDIGGFVCLRRRLTNGISYP